MAIDANHPIESLLFFIVGSASDQDAEAMHKAVDELAASRSWTIEPPKFVDESQDPDEVSAGDLPIRTAGGVIRLYAARPPSSLPAAIDRTLFDEATAAVAAMSRFSSETGHEIAFELDGCEVGWIEQGQPDDLLVEGFLDPWRKVVAEG